MESDSGHLTDHMVTGSPRDRGFKTYYDFFQSEINLPSDIRSMLYNPGYDRRWQEPGMFKIIDIQSDGTVSPQNQTSMRNGGPDAVFNLQECQSHIRNHDGHLRTRVIITNDLLHPRFLETFAFEYGLDPSLMAAIMLNVSRNGARAGSNYIYHALQSPFEKCSKGHSSFLDLGYGRFGLVKEVECGGAGEKHTLNIAFIFFNPRWFAPWCKDERGYRSTWLELGMPLFIFKFQFSQDISVWNGDEGYQNAGYDDVTAFIEAYTSILARWSPDRITTANSDAKCFLQPCLDFKSAELFTVATFASEARGTEMQCPQHIWWALRTDIEVTERTMESWKRLSNDSADDGANIINHDQCMRNAQRFECLIRDEQQLAIGMLSLEESKRAIE